MSLVDTGPLRTRSSSSRPLMAPIRRDSNTVASNAANTDVVVIARNLRRNDTFNPIRDGIVRLARASIAKQKRADVEDHDDGLSDYQEYGSDDDEPHLHEDEDDEVTSLGDDAIVPEFVLNGYIFGPREFEQIVERLPESLNGYKVKYELFDGKICIQTVPSSVHGSVVGVFNHTVTSWADDPANPGPGSSPLQSRTDGDYYYTSRRRKSPDASFVPKNIAIPPALPQPNSINPRNPFGDAYPTLVFECAYANEKWPNLLRDARIKAFARTTSVQVWVGLKVYKGTRELRAIWGKRRAQGYDMRIMKVTRRFSLDRPTRMTLAIPAALIFWGCPVIPPHIAGTNCVLKLEDIRSAISRLVP